MAMLRRRSGTDRAQVRQLRPLPQSHGGHPCEAMFGGHPETCLQVPPLSPPNPDFALAYQRTSPCRRREHVLEDVSIREPVHALLLYGPAFASHENVHKCSLPPCQISRQDFPPGDPGPAVVRNVRHSASSVGFALHSAIVVSHSKSVRVCQDGKDWGQI